MRLAFAIGRASALDTTWTTIHLAVEALRRGHQVRLIEPWDWEIDETGGLIARAWSFAAPITAESMIAALRRRTGERRYVDLSRVDLLMLRSAPLDPMVLSFAMLLKDRGVAVVNDPDGLMRVTNKGWLASLSGVNTPPAVVTRSLSTAARFLRRSDFGVVVKPARSSGGRRVSFVGWGDEEGLSVAFESARQVRDGYVVVQAYLPSADEGEKRLVWLDGALLGGYLRRRAPGEFRHNLKQGGIAEATVITEEEVATAAGISPLLMAAGIRLAGLDVIGAQLIEVNALNPGGAYHTDRLSGTSLAATILETLTRKDRT